MASDCFLGELKSKQTSAVDDLCNEYARYYEASYDRSGTLNIGRCKSGFPTHAPRLHIDWFAKICAKYQVRILIETNASH